MTLRPFSCRRTRPTDDVTRSYAQPRPRDQSSHRASPLSLFFFSCSTPPPSFVRGSPSTSPPRRLTGARASASNPPSPPTSTPHCPASPASLISPSIEPFGGARPVPLPQPCRASAIPSGQMTMPQVCFWWLWLLDHALPSATPQAAATSQTNLCSNPRPRRPLQQASAGRDRKPTGFDDSSPTSRGGGGLWAAPGRHCTNSGQGSRWFLPRRWSYRTKGRTDTCRPPVWTSFPRRHAR